MRLGRRDTTTARKPTPEAEALWRRVHPPEPAPPPEPTVAELVAQELARQRQAEADERRRAEHERHLGGPCKHCGCDWSALIQSDGTLEPYWNRYPDHIACGTCDEWRGEGDADELLDKVAAILVDEGFKGLVHPDRFSFRYERGLAAKLGVVAWTTVASRPACVGLTSPTLPTLSRSAALRPSRR